MNNQRKPGQYWVKLKWPTAVNGYIWVVATWNPDGWSLPIDMILEVDENMLVYIEPQYRSKKYEWPDPHKKYTDTILANSLKNIGEILQEIHQQLVISNQKPL